MGNLCLSLRQHLVNCGLIINATYADVKRKDKKTGLNWIRSHDLPL